MDDKLITIDTQSIILSRDKSGEIMLTPDAKGEIEKILHVKKLIEEVYDFVQEKLSLEMEKQGLKKVIAGNIIITKRFYGSRYQIDNKEEVDPKFIKEEIYTKPNVDAIEKHFEKTGEMPDFVSLKERVEKATITERVHDE